MSGILLKSARLGLLNLRRSLPFSCTDFEPLKIVGVDTDNKHGMLKIKWVDGAESKYPYVWLQDCAPTNGCRPNYPGPENHPLPLLAELNLEVKPESVELLPVGQGVVVEWPPYNKVKYPASWLRQHFAETDSRGADDVTLWDRNTMVEMGGVPLVNASVGPVIEHSTKIQQYLLSYGIVRVRQGLGLKDEILETLGVKLEDAGGLLATCYARQVNDLHTGVPFSDPIPNLATFGISRKPAYGHLQLVDGFMVAKLMREQNPFTFRYLSTTEINYCREDKRGEFENLFGLNSNGNGNLHPVFGLKNNGLHVDRVVFCNPCRSSKQEIPPETVHEFYAALKLFSSICYSAANVINVTPDEGDLFLLDNNRILHGTTAFEGDEVSRVINESFYHWNL